MRRWSSVMSIPKTGRIAGESRRNRGLSQEPPTRRTKTMIRCLLLATVLSAIVLTACDGSGKADVRNAVADIAAAINDRDYETLFEDFSLAGCKQGYSLEAFIANFQRESFQVTDMNLLDQNIIIDRDTAYLIVTATFEFGDGRSETLTFQDALVEEDGRWRDGDCFEGPLGGPG
jgi:hypothetical protein